MPPSIGIRPLGQPLRVTASSIAVAAGLFVAVFMIALSAYGPVAVWPTRFPSRLTVLAVIVLLTLFAAGVNSYRYGNILGSVLLVLAPFFAIELAYVATPTLFIDVLGYEPWYLIWTGVDAYRGCFAESLFAGFLAFAVGQFFAYRSIHGT